ncbi:protein kinase [Streptomyces sp. NPDC004284]|uniref:protein kinase domain-containing protein n=1 Tax=Streptomyces sp. NPDC004284 TaxID=3364695 RepID=UPI00369CDFFE
MSSTNKPDGQVVGEGRYVLRSLLGEGGMATVHLGHDTVLDRLVAVKLLHADLARQESFRERFMREAKAVASLNHVNIVSVFDSGEGAERDTPEPYIVMEYVEGWSLRDLLDRHVADSGAMPVRTALRIVDGVLAALSESHARGLIHRDIKPGNVMMTRRDTVKVMDFGIARAMQSELGSMTQTGMVVGTPQYLSPEQALGRRVDERSDLYSVGCMLFELLTGRLPFEADSPLGMAYQHVQAQPPAPSLINPRLPPALDHLLATALAKDPAQRHRSADAMRAAIDALLTHEEPSGTRGFGPPLQPAGTPYTPTFTAAPYPQAAPAPMPVQRSRKALVWGASAAAVLVLGVVITLTPDGGDRQATPPSAHPGKSATATAAPSGTPDGQVVTGDTSLTMPATDCTKPQLSQDGKISVPWFKLHHIDSVRACATAGGWKLTEKERDETLWGKGIVVDQSPIGTQVDPDLKAVTVWVSTGTTG